MQKSIEAIWKDGFLQQDALVAPEINDLYNQKSSDLVDKMTRMYRINLQALLAFAAVAFIASLVQGIPYSGIAFCSLFIGLVIPGKKHLNTLEQIDKSVSSYQYLRDFRNWREKLIANYAKIYTVFYPALFLILIVSAWSNLTEPIEKVLAQHPEIELVYGVPLWGITATLVITCFLAFAAGALYRFDMNLVYGPTFKKLDEIIADMEELKS
ncbi:MAG: hypothetical protein ACI906_004848 [Candidatus Latescibacterota bacterium]|jgi:hypothetical protein